MLLGNHILVTPFIIPFGMTQPRRSWSGSTYRYGYNGVEKDDELKEYIENDGVVKN